MINIIHYWKFKNVADPKGEEKLNILFQKDKIAEQCKTFYFALEFVFMQTQCCA